MIKSCVNYQFARENPARKVIWYNCLEFKYVRLIYNQQTSYKSRRICTLLGTIPFIPYRQHIAENCILNIVGR